MVWNEGSATLMGGAAHHISPTRDPTCSSGNSVCTSAAFDAGKAIIVDTACENNAANMGELVHYTCPVQLDTAEVTESVTGATIPGALEVASRKTRYRSCERSIAEDSCGSSLSPLSLQERGVSLLPVTCGRGAAPPGAAAGPGALPPCEAARGLQWHVIQ